jgi:hypothetical protein
MDHRSSRLLLPGAAIATLLATTSPAQHLCYDLGSQLVPAAVTASPTLLGCAAAPAWPSWHLFTPEHREPCARKGFNPGSARALPRIIVVYRCTGYLLVPVVAVSVQTMGYVIDRPEIPCVKF